MAYLYDATLVPSKRDLLDTWLPQQEWCTLASLEFDAVGSFRLDDPLGEVGMEGFLLGPAEGGLFVPLTYRDAALDDGDHFLIGTTEHSALGTRYVYDAWGDPAWLAVVEATIRAAGTEAVEEVQGRGVRQPSATVRGSGGDGTHLEYVRVLGEPLHATATLTASWAGGTAVVAGLH